MTQDTHKYGSHPTPQITAKLDRKAGWLILLGSVTFLLLISYWAVSEVFSRSHYFFGFNITFILGALAAFPFLFFLFGSCMILRMLLRSRPVIIADRYTIFDHRTLDAPVPWSEVIAIQRVNFFGQDLLVFTINNPFLYIHKWYKRKGYKINFAFGLPGVAISFANMKISSSYTGETTDPALAWLLENTTPDRLAEEPLSMPNRPQGQTNSDGCTD